MVEVEVSETERGNQYRPGPAHHHGEELHGQHDDEREIEDVIPHHEADDLLIDETRVGIQQRVDS